MLFKMSVDLINKHLDRVLKRLIIFLFAAKKVKIFFPMRNSINSISVPVFLQ